MAPELVAEFLRVEFSEEPLLLPPTSVQGLVDDLLRRGVSGGAVYDGLIALTAAHYEAELLTLDRRAERTYRRCGVRYRLLPLKGR
jgi:predicted nucleic acid-binding protein